MLSQSPFAPRFLSRLAAASSSASVVPEVLFLYWQRSIRVDCWISKLFTRQPRITDRPTHEQKVFEKTVRFSEKLTCSK